jgi:hypothetical protein
MSNANLWADVKRLRAEEHKHRQIAFECFNFRPEYADAFEAADREADYCRARRIDALKSIKLHHLAAFHGSHEHRSTSYLEAAE